MNAYYYVEEANLKRLHNCMISTIWHSGKDKTKEIVKSSLVARGWRKASSGEERSEEMEHRGFLEQ